jgi:hypothetical protein
MMLENHRQRHSTNRPTSRLLQVRDLLPCYNIALVAGNTCLGYATKFHECTLLTECFSVMPTSLADFAVVLSFSGDNGLKLQWLRDILITFALFHPEVLPMTIMRSRSIALDCSQPLSNYPQSRVISCAMSAPMQSYVTFRLGMRKV